MFNLINESWIPVKRGSTEKPDYISPWQITAPPDSDPIIALAAPRPDFNGAMIQFLIGLVQTSFPPSDPQEWRRKFNKPPSPDELKSAFGRYVHVFNLDGDGPRFMQDLDLNLNNLEQREREKIEFPIEELVLEMPGDITKEENRDFFIKRGTAKTICPSCCAMALYTLQTHAPSGGPGYRESVRKGSPLTTIVLGRTLWETVWLNVVTKNVFDQYGNPSKQADSDKYPWMGATRTSENDEETTFQDVNGAQMFWGMPWRIKIPLEPSNEDIQCDLCGRSANRSVRTFYRTNYGINYKRGWYHTLTPYYEGVDPDNELKPFESEISGITYRHWLGLIQYNSIDKIRPAKVVHTFKEERKDVLEKYGLSSTRLWAFGYKMRQRKALYWNDSTMPFIMVNPEIVQQYESIIFQLITSANTVITKTRFCVKDALIPKKAKTKTKILKQYFSSLDYRFWQSTESDFYMTINQIKNLLEQKKTIDDTKNNWLILLKNQGESLFDQYSQSEQIASVTNPRRIVDARKKLLSFLNSNKMYESLDLPKPMRNVRTTGKRKRG